MNQAVVCQSRVEIRTDTLLLQHPKNAAPVATPRLALVNLRSLEKQTFGLFANVALQLHDAAVIRVLPQTYQK